MKAKDFYKILSVPEGASQDEIKKAYRRLAKQCHPDANPGNKEAEERFKEISEAYDVLGDPKKRQQYNQMRKFGFGGQEGFRGFDLGNFDFSGFRGATGRTGQRGHTFEGSDLFSGLGSLFSQVFDFDGRSGQRQHGPKRGEDILVQVSVPFELAVSGGKTIFSVEKERTCPSCNGGGAKPGSRVNACPECHGRGTVTVSQGGFGISRPCPQCYGKGQIIENPCDRCHGSGVDKGKRSYTIKVPAGAEDGKQIRLRGEGQPSASKSPPGDMIVMLRVQPHRFFSLRGNDIHCDVPLSLKQAVKGSKIRVKTTDGRKVQVNIPAGTQDGTSFRLAGMGMTRNGKKGNQYVTVSVRIPPDPTEEEKELLKQYERMKMKR